MKGFLLVTLFAVIICTVRSWPTPPAVPTPANPVPTPGIAGGAGLNPYPAPPAVPTPATPVPTPGIAGGAGNYPTPPAIPTPATPIPTPGIAIASK